jgi:hypothetical protein
MKCDKCLSVKFHVIKLVATGAFDSNFFGLLLVMKQQMQVFQISLVLTLVKTQQTLVNQILLSWL